MSGDDLPCGGAAFSPPGGGAARAVGGGGEGDAGGSRGEGDAAPPPPEGTDPLRVRPAAVFGPLIISLRVLGASTWPASVGHKDFVAAVTLDADDIIVAVESNFGHKCTHRYDRPLKAPKPQGEGKTRQRQGDGTCFGSAIESRIDTRLDPDLHPDLVAQKRTAPVSVRYFPRSGDLQVTGSKSPDRLDALTVARHWVRFLNAQGIVHPGGIAGARDAAENSAAGGAPAAPGEAPLTNVRTNMINHRFAVDFSACRKRLLLDLDAVADILAAIAATRDPTTMGGVTIRRIREVSPPSSRDRTNFRVHIAGEADNNKTSVNIFPSGKINVAGAKNEATAGLLYRYLGGFFARHWYDIVFLEPLPDSDEESEESEEEAGAAAEASGEALKGGAPPKASCAAPKASCATPKTGEPSGAAAAPATEPWGGAAAWENLQFGPIPDPL